MKEKMYRICVYGSLRKGGSLNYMLGSEPLTTILVNNFLMYDLGAYPAIYQSDDPKHQIVAEVYNVTEAVFNTITLMEKSAGYTTWHIPDLKAYIYVYKEKPKAKLIESGDWIEYQESGAWNND